MSSRFRHHRALAGFVFGLAISWPAAGVQAGSTEVVYVASANAGPLTGYSAGSSGQVAPITSVANPNLSSTVWDPWGVVVDQHGSLYVQTFLSDATSFVFGPTTGRPLSRVFRGDGPDSRAIAVDGNGFEYVATGEGSPNILVLAPNAAGSPANLYSVTPLRVIATDDAGFPWPNILTTDSHNEVLAALSRSQSNAIEVFNGGASGDSTPLRVISGPNTGLGAAPADHVALVFSPFTGRLYVAVSAGPQSHISVFAGDATGDARPLRTIVGPATGLAGKVITGITDSQQTGDIYAMVKDAQFGGRGQVIVYGRLDDGNVAPRRAFSDASTSFADAQGITIASQ